MTPPHAAADGQLFRILHRIREAAGAHRGAAVQLPPPLIVHEVIEGRGEVYLGGQLLTAVDYRIKDVEEVDKTVFPMGDRGLGEPTDVRTGQRGTFGWLFTPSKDYLLRPYVGTPLTLALHDGRVLSFAVTKVLWMNHYLVQGDRPDPAAAGATAAG